MLIYLYWPKDGSAHIQAFHKLDKAVHYVIEQIETYSLDDMPRPKKKKYADPPAYIPAVPDFMFENVGFQAVKKDTQEKNISSELSALRNHLIIAKKTRNLDNAIKAIALYEEYAKYILHAESAIHTLQDIKIVE